MVSEVRSYDEGDGGKEEQVRFAGHAESCTVCPLTSPGLLKLFYLCT